MAVFTSFTIIRCLALFHLAIAFILLTNPRTLTDQNIVIVLGESMGLPHVSSFKKPNAATAFLGLLFAFLGLSDLTAVSMQEEIAAHYWGSQIPVRLLLLFSVTSYTYMFKKGGIASAKGLAYKPGFGEELKNSLVFTFGFLEVTLWFWAYVTLRDEKRQIALRTMEKRKKESKAT